MASPKRHRPVKPSTATDRPVRSITATAVGFIPTETGEYWTARQRQASRLHEISYRACFKPQLPAWFIDRFTKRGDVVYDPFMGRGTTPLEAALRGRVPFGNDINPLARLLVAPRITPPTQAEVTARLEEIATSRGLRPPASRVPETDLLVFFHPETLAALQKLRAWFANRLGTDAFDHVDAWIRMVALNRLTGHSAGFFSVYTLPPNQAASAKAQRKINADRNQAPPPRDIAAIIAKKSRILLSDTTAAIRRTLASVAEAARFTTSPADANHAIEDDSVALVVTSPPFLDVVDYATDNWLRCWFAGIDPAKVRLTNTRRIEDWQAAMNRVFRDLHRVLRRGGRAAFEVGEIRGGKVRLEEYVVPAAVEAGLEPERILINSQRFTKTAHCWGVENADKGTNTNRIVLLRRP